MPHHPAKIHERPRGHVMVSSALLLFALFGLLGLVVDLGRARVGLRSLEASAEFAAREVVRLRGDASLPDELARREYVSQQLYNLSATMTTQRAATARGEGEYDVQYDEQGFAVVDVAADA